MIFNLFGVVDKPKYLTILVLIIPNCVYYLVKMPSAL
jgi:hypothetical protein